MRFTKYKNWYRVYTGPFKDQDEANLALVKIKRRVSKDAYVTNTEITNNQTIRSAMDATQAIQKKISTSSSERD